MGKMKLPVVEFHEISSGLQHSYALSIILAHDEISEWYNENYILPIMYEFNLKTVASTGEYLDGYAYSDISVYKDILFQHGYSADFISPDNLLNYIRQFIHLGEYVIVFLDEYDLPSCMMGGKSHFLHEQLIYGYDDELQILYALGMNISGHYGAINHKYSDFIEAYRKGIMCENHADIEWASKNRIITLEAPQYRRKYKFEKSNVVSSINRYLFPILTNRERYKLFTSSISKIYLGIDCYDLIEKYINCELDSFPLLHLINEHKRIFYDHLITFEISDNELKKYYSLVLKPSEKLRMRSLKRRYDSLNKQIQRTDILMMELLNVLKENEIQYLQNLVTYL